MKISNSKISEINCKTKSVKDQQKKFVIYISIMFCLLFFLICFTLYCILIDRHNIEDIEKNLTDIELFKIDKGTVIFNNMTYDKQIIRFENIVGCKQCNYINNKWSEILFKGWVYGNHQGIDYCSKNGNSILIVNDVPLYLKKSIKNESRIGIINKGMNFEIELEEDDIIFKKWYYIIVKGFIKLEKNSFKKNISLPKGITIITDTIKEKKITTLTRKVDAKYGDLSKNYLKISINAWIAEKYLKDIYVTDRCNRVFVKHFINARTKPSTKTGYIIGKLNKNLCFNKISEIADPKYSKWFEIEINGLVKFDDEIVSLITTSFMNLKSNTSINYQMNNQTTILTLSNYIKNVKIQNISKEWVKIFFKGWVAQKNKGKEFIKEIGDKVTILVDDLYARIDPTVDSTKIGTLRKGVSYSLLSKINDSKYGYWYEIDLTGFINISKKAPPKRKKTISQIKTNCDLSVKHNALVLLNTSTSHNKNLYSIKREPNSNSEDIELVHKLTKIQIIDKNNSWRKVRFVAQKECVIKEGWISDKFIFGEQQ